MQKTTGDNCNVCVEEDHIAQLLSKVRPTWAAVSRNTPSYLRLMRTFSVDDLRDLFIYFEDPTGVHFTNAVLHGNQEFYDSLLTSKNLGPYLRVWTEHVTERLIARGIDTMKELKDDQDLPPALRLSAAKGLVAFHKNYSRQERKALRDYSELKESVKASRKSKDDLSEEEQQALNAGVDLSLDFDRIVSKTSKDKPKVH